MNVKTIWDTSCEKYNWIDENFYGPTLRFRNDLALKHRWQNFVQHDLIELWYIAAHVLYTKTELGKAFDERNRFNGLEDVHDEGKREGALHTVSDAFLEELDNKLHGHVGRGGLKMVRPKNAQEKWLDSHLNWPFGDS